MKLKDLRNLAKTIRSINIALVLLGVSMVLAMGVWCALFQSDIITTVQWVALELMTVSALSFIVSILNFFCDVNSDVQTRLTKSLRKYKLQTQARMRTAAAQNAAITPAEHADMHAAELRIVNS